MKIYNGYERMPRNYTLMSDEYEFTMANGYLNNGKEKEEAVFDIFFRKVPNNGGYAIMAGLDKIIPYIENLKFGEQELDYFRRKGYPQEFVEYLKNFKFYGDIYAIPDGTPVFPNEPIVTVKAPLIEAQIVETALLSIVNGAMEHATGARRIIEAVPDGVGVMELIGNTSIKGWKGQKDLEGAELYKAVLKTYEKENTAKYNEIVDALTVLKQACAENPSRTECTEYGELITEFAK